MIWNLETAHFTAEQLLQIKAIKLQPENPFTWASGWKSPIYCDNRITLSYPPLRTYLREQMAKGVEEKYGMPDAIAGVATGAIAIGILVAQAMNVPFVYVRPEPKSHGRKNQIEGHLEPGQRVVVIEDLVSTGGSSLKAVQALREAGHRVLGMGALFTYGFAVAKNNFKNSPCDLFALSDYDTLLKEASSRGYINEDLRLTLSEWRYNPAEWQGINS